MVIFQLQDQDNFIKKVRPTTEICPTTELFWGFPVEQPATEECH